MVRDLKFRTLFLAGLGSAAGGVFSGDRFRFGDADFGVASEVGALSPTYEGRGPVHRVPQISSQNVK
jgi:hypothetical protein